MKILFSPGYGAGWVTWHSGTREEKKFMLTYEPFIQALEKNKKISQKLIEQFEEAFETKFSRPPPYLGGCSKMQVKDVDGPFEIREYDGSETVELIGISDKVFFIEEF
jgi:hypothetical protein